MGRRLPIPDLGPPTVEFLMAALSNNVLEIKDIASGTDLEQRDPNPQGNQKCRADDGSRIRPC